MTADLAGLCPFHLAVMASLSERGHLPEPERRAIAASLRAQCCDYPRSTRD